jgi:hypothetical protein
VPNDGTRIAESPAVAESGTGADDQRVTPLHRTLGPTLARLLVGCLACWLLAGCDSGTDAAPPVAEPTPLVTSRPHFTGALEVDLQIGRIVYGGDDCRVDPADDRVCDRDEDRSYLVFGEAADARVVEARMDLSDDSTSWTVTLEVSPESAPDLRRYRELARSSGAVVLVLDEVGEALVMATVPQIEGRRITFENRSKPEAWTLVERFSRA